MTITSIIKRIRAGRAQTGRPEPSSTAVPLSHADIRADRDFVKLYERVAPFTLTSIERVYALYESIKHVSAAGLPGEVVECGVWKGGSMMLAALVLLEIGDTSRHLFLYDTFEGMTDPTLRDLDFTGRTATELLEDEQTAEEVECRADLDTVKENLYGTGYPTDQIHFIKGKVEDTIPSTSPDHISILRLDTDWYDSTRHELNCLYPRVVTGGVVIIDDYGHWVGARSAVDEYLGGLEVKPFMMRIDYSGRVLVKSS